MRLNIVRSGVLSPLFLASAFTMLPACGSSTQQVESGDASFDVLGDSSVVDAPLDGRPSDVSVKSDADVTTTDGNPISTDTRAEATITDTGVDVGAETIGPVECTATYTGCTGLCGPITDTCTGQHFECGGCATGLVCDLAAHLCGKPKTTCEELGAKCGLIRNSCGLVQDSKGAWIPGRLDCGTCPAGQECDPDSNQCIACINPSCQDLGFECGEVWLGCGPKTQLTQCGGCSDGLTCNAVNHHCEPKSAPSGTCKPPSTAAEIAAWCSDHSAECGVISDGCGGTVECGTGSRTGFNTLQQGCPNVPTGQAPLLCAIGGVANRCSYAEYPACAAEGRECGKLKQVTACGGADVLCGPPCPTGEVCNDNGRCGPACKPKTLAEIPDAASRACGVFDDACGGKVTKTCPDASQVCTAQGTCCGKKTCADVASGVCGTALDDGCGGTSLSCPTCPAGQACKGGLCCALPVCKPGQCGTLTNECGSTVCAPCAGGLGCNAKTNTCGALPTCDPGECGTDSNDFGSVTCRCPTGSSCVGKACCGNPSCVGVACGTVRSACGATANCGNTCGSGYTCTTDNKCCQLPVCEAGKCGPKENACGKVTCGCPSGQGCNATTGECGPLPTCPTGVCGPYPNDFGSVNCTCPTGSTCKDKACCQLPKCDATQCGPISNSCGTVQCKKPSTCSGKYAGKCGTALTDDCGGTVNCPCTGTGSVCSATASGQAGTCTCPGLKKCSDFANQCGTFPNGCGGQLSCGCADHKLPAHMTCGGGGQSGVCGCTKSTCAGRCGLVDDGCGGVQDCGAC